VTARTLLTGPGSWIERSRGYVALPISIVVVVKGAPEVASWPVTTSMLSYCPIEPGQN